MAANVELAELEALERQLQMFNASFSAEWQRLNASWGQLDATWDDQQKVKFRRDWDQTVHQMKHYIQESDKYITFLQSRIRAIREYGG